MKHGCIMDISSFCIYYGKTVNDAMKQIDLTGKKIVFAVDENERLVGVLTDGDMRRHLLAGGTLTSSVSDAMNPHPIQFTLAEEDQLNEFWKKNRVIAVPIVDGDGKVVKARFWDEDNISAPRKLLPEGTPVVIMAGGLGSRLYPYTKILPKPLIPIGDVPITELIIQRFVNYGASMFYLVINHKKNMIKAYFNEIKKDYGLEYVVEEQFLGTAGGMTMLKGKIDQTFFVSNCDILIDSDYECMYDYHKFHGNKITVVCAMKNFTIPYGVMEMGANGEMLGITEKPEYSFLTNTGVYIIEPEILDSMEEGVHIHMTDLAKNYMEKGGKVGVYPVTEKSWLDMGQLEEMKEMMKAMGVD